MILGKEYAKADSRWGAADPTIVSLEIVTVLFNGSLCILLIYAILSKSPYRYKHMRTIIMSETHLIMLANIADTSSRLCSMCVSFMEVSPSHQSHSHRSVYRFMLVDVLQDG